MNRSFILRITLTCVFVLAGSAGVFGQGIVSLYLKADPTSYLVTNLPEDDERLSGAVALPASGDQANIWKWVELQQEFEGHVRKTYVTKGLSVQVGAPVYFIPGDEDAFLTIIEDGSNAEVIESVGDWVKIKVNASIPVYFETDQPAELPEMAVEPVEPVEPVPAPVEDSFEVESAVVQDDPLVEEPSDLQPDSPYLGEPIDRILEGKLVAYKPLFSNPWRKPSYKWQILNRRKKRVAFVDVNNLILDRPIESFEGRNVSLAGSIFQINKGKDLVIVANQLNIL